MRNQRRIYLVFLGWLLFGDLVSSAILSLPLVASIPALRIIASMISLSNILSVVFGFISGLMIDFWALIPFLKL